MENIDFIWLLAFTTELILGNTSFYMLLVCLKNKPILEQSIYDQVLVDSFLAGNLYGTWICMVVIATRFEIVRFIIHEYPLFTTTISSVTTFGRVAISICLRCLCLVRILYIYDMNFIEETLGEKKVRIMTFATVAASGIAALAVLIVKDEVVSGLIVLYTGQKGEIIGKYILDFKILSNIEFSTLFLLTIQNWALR